MALVKAHEVDRYLAKPDPSHSVFLIYGPDKGLVSERATKLAKATGVDLADPFSTIKLDADDAAADPARLADEAHTVSMFGGKRLVWIRGSTLKNLAKSVQSVLDLPPADCLIIIEAGDLKSSAPLRTRIEKAKTAISLPCFQDQSKAIDGIIDEELREFQLTIDVDAREFLKTMLGGDRMASRAEVQKLCLYASNQDKISIDDISLIVGDASSLAVDTLIDAASTGDISLMELTFRQLISQGTAIFQITGALQRQFQMLHQARCSMESSSQSASSIVGSLRPPINFKRKDKVARALSIWKKQPLERILKRVESLTLESRSNAALAVPLISTTLMAITVEANRGSRRG